MAIVLPFFLLVSCPLLTSCSEEDDTVEEYVDWQKRTIRISTTSTTPPSRRLLPATPRGRFSVHGHWFLTQQPNPPTSSWYTYWKKAQAAVARCFPIIHAYTIAVVCCRQQAILKDVSSTPHGTVAIMHNRRNHPTCLSMVPLPVGQQP